MNQVRSGALMSYIAMAINIIIGIVYTPWMIKSIGKEDYGLYTLAMSVINMFIFDLGLGTAIQRYVAKFIAENKFQKITEFLSVTFRIYFFIDILFFLGMLVLYFFIPQIYQGLTPTEIAKFKIIFVVAAIFSVISFPFVPVDGILSANEKFIEIKICELLHKILIVLLMSVCLLLDFGLYALITVNAIAGLMSIAAKWYFLKKRTKTHLTLSFWDNELFKEILNFSIWVFIIAICQRLVLSIAPSILGMYNNSEAIAMFGLALSIEGYFFLFANALNGLFLPRVSQMIASNKNENLLPLMIKVGRIQIIIIGLVFIGLISFGKHFINVWVGSEFESIYFFYIIMILPSFIILPENIANTAMIANNYVKYGAFCSILKAVTNIILAFPLAKYYGVAGICMSVSISYGISLIASNIVYRKIVKLDVLKFFKQSFGVFIIPLFILLAIGLFINAIIPSTTWLFLLIKCTLFSLVYVSIIYITSNNEERSLILTPILKTINILRNMFQS